MSPPRLYIEPDGSHDFTPPREARCQIGSVHLRSLVDEVLQSLAENIQTNRVHVDLDVPASHRVLADSDMLRRCVMNLAVNAIEAMPAGGELAITSYMGARGLELEIADSGPGLSEEARHRAFEPYFTTKPQSAGLGLSIVAYFAEAHGGSIDVRNCPEGGAAFTIRIPQRAMQAAA